MTWGKEFVYKALVMTLSELIWRFGVFLRECIFYWKHYPYEKKYLTAFKYCFHFYKRSCWFLGLLVLLVTYQFQDFEEIHDHILKNSSWIIIWWIARWIEFSKSRIDFSHWIRSENGLDYSTGMAANYYFGFLKFILSEKSLYKRMETYEDKHRIPFALKRLIILIPSSLYTSSVLDSPLLERQDNQSLEVQIDRAGVCRRYINNVYRIDIDGEPYYITAEGAAPMQSYYDAMERFGTCNWEMRMMQKEIILKFYRYLKNILEMSPETKGQCEVVYYNDTKVDGRSQDVGEVLRDHIKEVWRKEQLQPSLT